MKQGKILRIFLFLIHCLVVSSQTLFGSCIVLRARRICSGESNGVQVEDFGRWPTWYRYLYFAFQIVTVVLMTVALLLSDSYICKILDCSSEVDGLPVS
jgi:hypothetical protein